MRNQLTFAQHLLRVEAGNAARLTQRAIAANRLAKILAGKPRAKAYRVKAYATTGLLRMNWASQVPDRTESNYTVLVHFKSNGCGLHLRRGELAKGAILCL
jgi:hypothetical protein